ncbi:phospholipase D family protein [Pusillimonas sp. CC-YST705]|uniref:Phospholipase D family protein n=2 Tax=Mesopusillimonas faecipullorum TaxID=2755040 RepID=A0ABS8C8Y5_9BURK|nr:phospholipase D family protein [Mesopusillimonas faecipullorum]
MGGCALPPLDGREASSALSQQEARATALGKAISPLADTHAGLSGIHPLADARDAFAARMSLVRAAERTLDVQYYIWRADMTGTLLLEALYEAADRGVRVRLLLDDNGIAGLDDELAALDAHANIQVRLFNPFLLRWPKMLGYFTDFSRLNRRMHNKSLTADNQVTIIGGRNIGDEYFGASDVIIVHSGYAKRREDLLRGGVQLYEMRSAASTPQPQGSRLLGSSGSSLHAKTFAVDGERVFVGSFNFDPRSAKLNTELGFVIDSPALARQVTRIFSQDVPRMAYRLGLDEDGEIYWLLHKDGQEQRFDVEPGTNWWQRATIKFLQLLPIDPLL